tara:strand:+ start:1124 stop:1414 length:291 start_codon:yes stop_codon:yes gene_type:complete
MKKLTMSVAALSIAMMSYGQINGDKYKQSVKTFQEIDMRIDDIISAIRMDMFYGRITQDNGMYYINEVMALKSKNEDLMSDLFISRLECENCDEID